MELLFREVLLGLSLDLDTREQEGKQRRSVYTIGIGRRSRAGNTTDSTWMDELFTEPKAGFLHPHDFQKPIDLMGDRRGQKGRASRTQAEEIDRTIVQKIADMPGVLGHRAERVCAAGCEGVHTAGAHVHEHRP